MASDFTFDDILALGQEAQTAIYERGNRFGTIGVAGSNGQYSIPATEKGKRLVTVTLEDGTLVKADTDGIMPLAGAKIRLRKEAEQYVIKGSDARAITPTDTNSSTAVGKHNHNIGNPLFTPEDPASIADGLILPTGNGLQVTVGRVTYPKDDGSLGIYESEDTQDLATAVTGLAANQSRWVVHYILRTDGTASFFSATAVTGALNYTTHIEDAVAECLTSEPNAYPYAVTKIRAGISTLGTYKAMQGRSPSGKDMVRLGILGGLGSTSTGSSGFGAAAIKTLSSDTFNAGTDRNIIVAAETGTSDDLIEITGLSVGDKILLRADTGDTITVKHNDAGATIKMLIQDDADFVLDEVHPLELILVSTNQLVQVYDEVGAGSDASGITYTPTDDTDWDSSADPGNVDDALDQLAARVDTIEAAGGGGSGNVSTGAAIDIPGLEASRDIESLINYAASTGISEEYDTATTGLTWSSAPDTENSDTDIPSHLRVQHTTGGAVELLGYRAWSPSGACEAQTKLAVSMDASGGTAFSGLIVADSTNANLVLLQLNRTQTTNQILVYSYNGAYTQRGSTWNAFSNNIWMRITNDGSNNWSWYFSDNGLLWNLIATLSFAFTIARVGYRVGTNSAMTVRMASDWLRTND